MGKPRGAPMSILESETPVNAFRVMNMGVTLPTLIYLILIRNIPWELILHTRKLSSFGYYYVDREQIRKGAYMYGELCTFYNENSRLCHYLG